MEWEEIKQQLAGRLKESRYRHSVGVSEAAAELAERFGVSVEKAKLAGLLHDCAREFTTSAMPEVAERLGIEFSPVERKAPLLLHAYIGAVMLSKTYGIDDSEIRQAIWRHTVGGEAMTDLDKVIYLADMIEVNRVYPGVDTLRRLAAGDSLDAAMLAAFDRSISFVLAKGGVIHPDTVLARNEILLRK